MTVFVNDLFIFFCCDPEISAKSSKEHPGSLPQVGNFVVRPGRGPFPKDKTVGLEKKKGTAVHAMVHVFPCGGPSLKA